jgi:hypothetical protein
MAKTKLQSVIKRGMCDVQNGEFVIPDEFKTIRELWQKQDPECLKLIKKYIVALFIPSNLAEAPAWLHDEDADELQASVLEVIGLVFTDDDLPLVTAVAVFDLPTTHVVSNAELEQWQEEADEHLDNALSFEWILDASDEKGMPPSHGMTVYDELRLEIID